MNFVLFPSFIYGKLKSHHNYFRLKLTCPSSVVATVREQMTSYFKRTSPLHQGEAQRRPTNAKKQKVFAQKQNKTQVPSPMTPADRRLSQR